MQEGGTPEPPRKQNLRSLVASPSWQHAQPTPNRPYSPPARLNSNIKVGIRHRGERKIRSALTLDIFDFRPEYDSSAIISKLIDLNSLDSLAGQSVTGHENCTRFWWIQ
jgi:hypothetical protein